MRDGVKSTLRNICAKKILFVFFFKEILFQSARKESVSVKITRSFCSNFYAFRVKKYLPSWNFYTERSVVTQQRIERIRIKVPWKQIIIRNQFLYSEYRSASVFVADIENKF